MATEKRLIDANAFLKSLEWECGDVCEQTEYSDYLETEYGFSRDAINQLVQNAPTVDAVEVVHGHWIVKEHSAPYGGYHLFHCSECDEPNAREKNYCPNCGADMRERKDNG